MNGDAEFEQFPIYFALKFALKAAQKQKWKRDVRLLCDEGVYESRKAAEEEYQRMYRAKMREGKTVTQREVDKDAELKKVLKASGNQISLRELKRKLLAASKLEKKCPS